MAIHIHKETDCAAPIEKVFAYVADYRNVQEWLYGIQKFVPTTEKDYGHRRRLRRQHPPGRDAALDDRGDRLRGRADDRDGLHQGLQEHIEVDASRRPSPSTTRIIADVCYSLPGGIAGKALGKVIEPFVKIAVRHSSEHLARNVSA